MRILDAQAVAAATPWTALAEALRRHLSDPIASPPRSVVDPTGAGDAYRGGFIKGLLSGADWATCGRLGALTASYCVESHGTNNYTFDAATFGRRFAEAFGMAAAESL